MAALALARLLVRAAPFPLWRGSLGELVNQPVAPTPEYIPTEGDRLLRARALANRVERAAWRLPGTSKCLPQAMALQWLMRGDGLSSVLVIAAHRHDLGGDHGFHAWVETGGEMLIGECERDDYAPLASFGQPARGAAPERAQTDC